MPNENVILGDKRFWFFYVRVTDAPLEGDILDHFDTVYMEDEEFHEARISLPCGAKLSLDVTISAEDYSVELGLRDTETNNTHQMGWWDDARWHPFALRWTELIKLHHYWTDRLTDIHPSAAFLLLSIFLGNGSNEKEYFSSRRDIIRSHYQKLQLFTDSEITRLTNKTLILPTEDDYDWKQDENLGWLFGGDYPCYSIRNREHSDGEEGLFPFAEWSALVDNFPGC